MHRLNLFEAGLVRGGELYFDATKIEANASLESITPRFAVEQRLQGLFEEEPQDSGCDPVGIAEPTEGNLYLLPTSEDAELAEETLALKEDIDTLDGELRRRFSPVPRPGSSLACPAWVRSSVPSSW